MKTGIITGLIFAAAAAILVADTAAVTVSGSEASAQVPAHVQPPSEDQAAVREAARRGTILYAYDQAAWHGTDDMLAKLPDPASKISGWIVDGPPSAPELVFFDKDPTTPRIVYVADFRDGRLVSSKVLGSKDNNTLSPARLSLIQARKAAAAAVETNGAGGCADAPMNNVVIPPDRPGAPTLVYFLTPQTEMKVIPLGGHYLVPVSADGKVGPIRRFANSCLNMALPESGGAKPAALFVTHLLDAVPTEIHVFSSLVSHMPIAVGTKNNRIWWVDGSEISLVKSP